MLKKIIVHGGGAHLDDLMAAALVMCKKRNTEPGYPISHHEGYLPIERRYPTKEELADPDVVVCDVGGDYAPGLSNFDHHQLSPSEHKSAMRLVAHNIVIPGQFYTFDEFMPVLCNWWDTAIDVDCQGPFKTAEEKGLKYEEFSSFIGPMPGWFLDQFTGTEKHPITPEERGHFVYDQVTTWLDDMVDAYFDTSAKMKVEALGGGIHIVNFYDCDPKKCELASGPLLAGHKDGVAIFHATPRDPSETYETNGLTLLRLHDDKRIDFNKVAKDPNVKFVHKSGFLCQTRLKDILKAKALILNSIV